MADKNVMTIVEGVEAMYPRINQPYRFDKTAGENGKTVPCDPFDEGAKYELEIRMSKEQATDLYKLMAKTYKERKDAKWPAMPKASEVFDKDDEGNFSVKANLKSSYGKEATKPPAMYDAKNQRLATDFELTTGSKINVQVALIPYNMNSKGVSLRLRAVQVIKLAEMKDFSPFGSTDGFTNDGFGVESDEDDDDMGFDDEPKVEAPKAKPKKAKVKEVADEIDDALDDLDFDD